MSLSSLIVQREIATIRQVEEALARQVLYGGDLVTNLLEVAVVDEARLNDVAAEAVGALAAPAGILPDPDPRARALIPGDLAVRRSLYPLRMNADAEQLLVAVAEPLSPREEEELMFALGVPLEQRLAPLVRVRQALARVYGAPLERRFERLAMRLAGESPRSPTSHPPLLGHPPSVRVPPRPESVRPGRVSGAPPRIPSQHPTSLGFPAPEPPTVPQAPIFTLDGMPAPAPPEPEEDTSTHTPTERMSLPPVVVRDERRETLLRQLATAPRPVRRRRGPMTLDKARAELDEVETRDALLDLFFDFARQYFEYSALFVVHGDVAEGHDAYGPGASRDKVLGIGVPLDFPGILAGARATSGPILRAPDRDGLDAVLQTDLERAVHAPVIALPIIVRGRCVAILYGDAAEAGVDAASTGDVIAFGALAGQAFERLILRKKLGGFSGVPSTNAGRALLSEQVTQTLAAAGSSKRASAPGLETSRGVDPARGVEALGRALLGDAAPRPAPAADDSAPGVEVPPEPPPSGPGGDAPFSVPKRRVPASPLPPPPNIAVVRRLSGPPIPREDPDDPTSRPPDHLAFPSTLSNDSVPPLPLVGVGGSGVGARASRPPVSRAPTPVPPTVVDAPPLMSPPGPEVTSEDLDDEAARSLLSEIEAANAELDAAPPSQSSIAVPPHKPPSSRTDGEALPSVIVDVGQELEILVERFIQNVDDEQAEAELLRQGQFAMSAIVARFPGPLVMEPRLDEEDGSPVSACGPLLRLIVMQRRIAVGAIVPFLDDPDEERRFWATFVVTELAYPEIIRALVPRFSDSSERVRRAARLAAAAIARSYGDEVARELGRVVRDTAIDRGRRLAMLSVLEDIRCAFAVPSFIAVLADADEEIALAARRALLVVTRQDFGVDTKRWTTWWNQSSSLHRIEWLIDALVHEAQPIRRAAGEELKAVTKEYFGYYDDLPKRERERAQSRYRDWWRTEGHLRFVR